MLEKILDNYYTKKLLEEIKWNFIVRNLNYKFEDDKYRVWIKIKPKKYSNDFYSTIIQINKDDALKYLCDLDNFRRQVDKIIIEYQKEKNKENV